MSCNRFHYEMSLNIDGRLPGGRRDALMVHLAECSDCGVLWEELLQAQELALSLPQRGISAEFSDSLWDRIRSGEGTPEAVFRGPVPTRTKVRYAVTGAVAAAAILLVANLFFTDPTPVPLPREQGLDQNPEWIADRATEPRPSPAPDARELALAQPALQLINPGNVAEAGALACVNSIAALQRQLPRIEPRIAEVPVERILVELREPVAQLRGSARLLRWMEEGKRIKPRAEFQAGLTTVETSLRAFEQPLNTVKLRVAVRRLQSLDIQHLRYFDVVCCQNPSEFLASFRDHFQRNPDARKVLNVEVAPYGLQPPSFAVQNGSPFGNMVLFLRAGEARWQVRYRQVERHGASDAKGPEVETAIGKEQPR